MTSTIKKFARLSFAALLTIACSAPQEGAMLWLTDTADGTVLFQRQETALPFSADSTAGISIRVDDKQAYQTMDGFGFTLTGGSAQQLKQMSAQARSSLLKELFDTTDTHIGISYLRLSIGASDLNEQPFSYNDLPIGQTDPEMAHFDLGPDRSDVVPILKEILVINPGIKLMGSPWSPPAWMKTNHDTRGGSLKPAYYPAYARYFVKYIQQMKAEGIAIDAVTVQNEPLHPGNNPSLLMLTEEMNDFIKNHLGPAFKQAGIRTKIVVYDHNADRPDYPISILNDPVTRKFVDGSAFHLYAGEIDALADVHTKHPDKHLYFTEQWIGAPGDLAVDMPQHIKQLTIGASRNWCRVVLEWNLSNSPDHTPHTDRGGCDRCLGGVTIDGDRVIRNPAYYIVAHAAKFVRPGAVRIASTEVAGLPNVAFKTADGQKVLIVLNEKEDIANFDIRYNERVINSHLKGGSVGTYVWK